MSDPESAPVEAIALKSASAPPRPFPWRSAVVAAAVAILGVSSALVLTGWGPEAARLGRAILGTRADSATGAPKPRVAIPPQMPAVSGVDSTKLVPEEPASAPGAPASGPVETITEPEPARQGPPPVSLQDAGADGAQAPVRSKPSPLRSSRGELDAPGQPAVPAAP